MLKCAPYIKSLCSSLHTGWWREGTSSLPGSPVRQHITLPSPTRSENAAAFANINSDISGREAHRTTGDECVDYDNIYITQSSTEEPNQGVMETQLGSNLYISQTQIQPNNLEDVKITSLLSPQPSIPAVNSSTAVVSISGNGEIVTSVIVNQPQSSLQTKLSPYGKPESSGPSSVKSDLIHVLKKIRPESPDVTRAAKKLEMARRLGAISKIPKQPHHQYDIKDTSTPPNSPSRR